MSGMVPGIVGCFNIDDTGKNTQPTVAEQPDLGWKLGFLVLVPSVSNKLLGSTQTGVEPETASTKRLTIFRRYHSDHILRGLERISA